MILVRIW